MLFDRLCKFSDRQSVSASADSDNTIDMEAVSNHGVHTSLEAVAVPCLAAGAEGKIEGSGTLTVALHASEDNADYAEVAVSGPLSAADMNNGVAAAIKVPHGKFRYCKLRYTVDGALTGLCVTAGLAVASAHPNDCRKYVYGKDAKDPANDAPVMQ